MSPRTGPVGIGVVGAGTISGTYLENLTSFPDVEVVAVGDLHPEAAAARAAEHGVGVHGDLAAVLTHPDVEVVLNLTVPQAHVEVSSAAIEAGKHVWSEKPLTLDRAGGEVLLGKAEAAGVRLGCAPDTFLGTGLQTALGALRRGDVGTPLSALTLVQSPGPESWHPNPAFLYQRGAGPLWDIGPYYLTLLVQAFGPVAAVAALGSTARATRVVGSGPRAGEVFDVGVPTQVSALLQFEGGQSAQTLFSFDSPLDRHGFVEVTGTDATLELPDPNHFDGDLRIRRAGAEDWEPYASTTAASTRGTGVLDLARAVREGRPHRAPGTLAHHVVDVLECVDESLRTRAFVDVTTTADVAELLPADWDPRARTL